MKKYLQLTILLFTLALLSVPVAAYESRAIVSGVCMGETTEDLLPLRDIIEHAGGTVTWNDGRITIRRGNHTATITIGSTSATVGNRTVELSAPPRLIDGRTMAPTCLFGEHLGFGVGYKNNNFILSASPARQIAVLTYHHILPDEVNTRFVDNPWTVSTEEFALQMRYLRDNGFYTPTLWELEAFLYHGRPLPSPSVMIHFDDGYYSNYVYAYPILRRYGLRAVIFPITANAEALGEYQPPICHNSLTWAAAGTLNTRTDVFETASHTHDLHSLAYGTNRTLLVTETRENIIADTLRSFEFVSNHRAFAYPHGQFNNTVIEALAEAGITMAFTINSGYVTTRSNPFQLNRFTIYRDTTMARFRAIVNGRG